MFANKDVISACKTLHLLALKKVALILDCKVFLFLAA